ncbi:hypothetical protein FBU31_000976 [Coemansia sp. 'formosensis']|nr:hypothetical protein FBU31_000976 [Coemansia sp. 'formosensis']
MSCMARVEANFWSRRHQVEALMNEAIAAQATKETDGAELPVIPPSDDKLRAEPEVAPVLASETTLAAEADAKPPPRIVDKFELNDALQGGLDDEDDEDEDDDSDSAEMSPVHSETVLHGTPPRGSKLKQFVEQGRGVV